MLETAFHPHLMFGMKPPPLHLGPLTAQGRTVEIEDRTILDTPFFVLRHYRKPLRDHQPMVLAVAPPGGQFGWLLRDMVADLLPRQDVTLLEWKDAADIPPDAGPFGLDRTIDAVIQAIRLLGPGVTVMGAAQSVSSVLAATAIMAAGTDGSRPCGMVLLGGTVETRLRRSPELRQLAGLPADWLRRAVVRPSALGRPVVPAAGLWPDLARRMARHFQNGGELRDKLLHDDGQDADRFPFLSLYATLMSLPAELVEDSAAIMREASLATGALTWHGQPVDLAAVSDVALMTVEGRRDESCGPGQTLLAHALCHRIPDSMREHHIEDEAGQFGLFHGRRWRDSIRPEVESFVAGAARHCPVRARRRLG